MFKLQSQNQLERFLLTEKPNCCQNKATVYAVLWNANLLNSKPIVIKWAGR